MTLIRQLGWLSSILVALYTVKLVADSGQHPLKQGRPNVVFILSDDQDLHMDSLSYMPYLKQHLTERGTSFRRHYCTVALCCPSRASLWTGKAAHNTNVTDINPPYGGYPKFVKQGFNDAYLPIWLQEAGYSTYYIGKLLNAQTVDNYNKPFPAGWTGSDFLLDPYTYEYLNATFQRNHDPPTSYEGLYSTDVLAVKSYDFLSDALATKKPFFLTIAPTAPHSNVNIKENLIDGNFSEHSVTQSPPIPAERHKHLFDDVTVPRTPHFNPSSPSSVSWISQLPQQNATNLASNDHFYRSRLRALQAVDEIIEGVVQRLSAAKALDNTYIIYSTDNGYHIGQHRLQPGKQCAIEEDINIPFIVRGPGVPEAKVVDDVVTTHTDLAPTFLKLAGAQLRSDLDGQAMPLTGKEIASAETDTARAEHVNVESWGIIMSEGKFGSELYLNHTYKSLRLVGHDYNLIYTVWCSGEKELYDLNHDPYQLHNLHQTDHQTQTIPLHPTTHRLPTPPQHPLTPNPAPKTVPLSRLLPRLDAVLLVLKSCKATQCTHPWRALHPSARVHGLRDALAEKHDGFYLQQMKDKRVQFERCEKGYIRESEGVMWEDGMGEGKRKSRVGSMQFEVGV